MKSGDHPDINMYHRFGTVVTKAGDILVTCEARVGGGDCDNPSSIFLWRSTNGGETWSDAIVVADYATDLCSAGENKMNGISGHF